MMERMKDELEKSNADTRAMIESINTRHHHAISLVDTK